MLFDRDRVNEVPWPETVEGQYAKEMLLPIMEKGASHFFRNVDADVKTLVIDDLVMPVTVNDLGEVGSYVCSPLAQFVTCAQDHIQKEWQGVRSAAVGKKILSLMGMYLGWGGINAIAYVDNWLVATNLHPELTRGQLENVLQSIIASHPKHAVGFRSVTQSLNPQLFRELKECGFLMIASRPIYTLDGASERPFKARMFRSDLRLLQESNYEIVDNDQIAEDDIPRICALYEALYLDKYSRTNPQINEAFISHVMQHGLWRFKALKKEGRVDGVVAYFEKNGLMTSPLFGYDTTLPQELGLYRKISTLLALEAKEKKMLLHQSSGAGSYKKLRRADSDVEYLAVYTQHLPKKQRITWRLLQTMTNSIGLRMMRNHM